MPRHMDWSERYSEDETKEEALIRIVNSATRFYFGYLSDLARSFRTTTMAVNKKLGKLRKAGKVKGYYGTAHESSADKGSKFGSDWSEDTVKGVASLNIVSEEFLEIEEALKKYNIDEDIWEVARFKRGCWTTAIAARTFEGKVVTEEKLIKNYTIAIVFKRKIEDAKEIAYERFIEKIPSFKYIEKSPTFVAPSGVALEIVPMDAHFAKLSWGKETLRGDYDLSIAVKNYEKVVEQNLSWGATFKPEKIFYIVGNDLMHSENYQGTTPEGKNILDVDTRLPKLIEAALEIAIKTVYRCRSVAPTEVIWIPGNHDPTASLWLCLALKQHFKDDKFVEIDTSPSVRKARLWGTLLVGWVHAIVSRHASWANELAQSFPKEWGKSVFREWHYGHKHKKSEVKTNPVMTHGGVLLRQLTALSPIDAWHFENLFTDAVPGGEAFLWSKTKGVFSNFVAWL